MESIKENEYNKFYKTYIDLADTTKSVVENLESSFNDALVFLKIYQKKNNCIVMQKVNGH